ncbi:hypothetical protein DXG03_003858 [Asterophora parasitica]|uniref:Uncharacterized protein n=1 Tax=Asterophora parasitica TaxID=117018 RepID=A0A9P7G907_9AGAR|nr:hypothetical protein DXG03_003858 [Asterophora parasitica]
MDTATSILGALDAGKLPSTQQLNQFIDWLDKVGIASIEPKSTGDLSSHGRLLAQRVRELLEAYKQLGMNKNGEFFSRAIWHLSQGDIATSGIDKDHATADINAVRSALRTLLTVVWTSLSSESGNLINDFASFTRLSLADAAELIESTAGSAKEGLRDIEQGVQKGERTNITGRDKKRVEEESGDAKAKWDHGMEAIKSAGDSAIDTGRGVSESVQDKASKTSIRVQDAYLKICDRAQSDPKFREAVDTIVTVLQRRTHQALDANKSGSLSSFFNDPTPEQHVPKALDLLQKFVERLSSTPLEPLFNELRTCVDAIVADPKLRKWFDDFFDLARKNLAQEGYARSDESQDQRKELRTRWNALLGEEDAKWRRSVDAVKKELNEFQEGLAKDKDLQVVRKAHVQLSDDIERGLVEAGQEAETGLEALMERASWFWQDLFRVYIPRVVDFLGELPIPRAEFKDSEIEFVLENLDISSLNLLPSHVYIRNITDVDITTAASPTAPARTAVGTLTRIKVDAVQLKLDDVSFWYKDLSAGMLAPSEISGLLALTLPPQGVSLDIKVRLIPATVPASNPSSRHAKGHFHEIEHVSVNISEDVSMEVKDSNHGVLIAMFKPIFVIRLREALEKSLAAQVRGALEWADGIAWDVGRRREVFEDTGAVGGGAAIIAALWSEMGRLRREGKATGEGWKVEATGTGVVMKQGEGDEKMQLAVGAEPQILSGEKRGPVGTASEPLSGRVTDAVRGATGVDMSQAVEQGGMDVSAQAGQAKGMAMEQASKVKGHAQGLITEGRKRTASFQTAVKEKMVKEQRTEGWRSEAFEF